MCNLLSKNLGIYIRQVRSYKLSRDAENKFIRYGICTLNKTRFNSHTNFLRKCLRNKYIPTGFKLKFHTGSASKGLSFANSSSMQRCSFQLIRNVIKENSWKLAKMSKERLDLKEYLKIQPDHLVWRELSTELHKLNAELYEYFANNKDKKLHWR